MKVLFLVPRLDKASTRYRVLQFFPFLQKNGVVCDIRTLSKTSRNWITLLREVKRSDVVFIQKKLFALWELIAVRLFSRCLIYDFDDAVCFKEDDPEGSPHARQRRRFSATVKRADLVIAGNAYLRELAAPFNSSVSVVPTSLDLGRYILPEKSRLGSKDLVLGWIGSKGTLKYLKEISPALETIGVKYPNVKLKIVADDFFDLESLHVIKKPWNENDEIADLHSFDIGLMPLTDDPWTRGKCGFKLLQCMAVGTPVICSPVGANREVVTDGGEGFYATTAEEWVERLCILIEDETLRLEMGARGRKKVEENYSLDVNAPRVLSMLTQGRRQ